MSLMIALCMHIATSVYELPPQALPSLLAVEGGKVGTVSTNKNRSFDMGPMQINSIWLDDIARKSGLSRDEVQDKLTNDGCFNVFVGAYILKKEITGAQGKFWDGVGHYHSRTPRFKARYQQRVLKAWQKMYGTPQVLPPVIRVDQKERPKVKWLREKPLQAAGE